MPHTSQPAPPVRHQRTRDAARLVVPYVTSWDAETDMPFEVVNRRGGGIAYADEIAADRDDRGILWTRMYSRQRDGRPEFGKVHSLR